MSKELRIEQLKIVTDSIINILCITKETFNYCKYFYTPQNIEESEFADSDYDIHIIRFTLWKQTIIEIAKLFSDSDNDKFRISKYLDSLKPAGYYGDLKFPVDKIRKYEEQIKLNSSVRSDILKIRNKIYAHTEEIYSERGIKSYYNIIVTFKQIETLISILQDIMIDVHFILFDSHLTLNIDSDEQNMKILSNLLAYRNIEFKNLIETFRKG